MGVAGVDEGDLLRLDIFEREVVQAVKRKEHRHERTNENEQRQSTDGLAPKRMRSAAVRSRRRIRR